MNQYWRRSLGPRDYTLNAEFGENTLMPCGRMGEIYPVSKKTGRPTFL